MGKTTIYPKGATRTEHSMSRKRFKRKVRSSFRSRVRAAYDKSDLRRLKDCRELVRKYQRLVANPREILKDG